MACHPAKALHQIVIRGLLQMRRVGCRDDRVDAGTVCHLIDVSEARLARLAMIRAQRLDGSKNNVGFALLEPSNGNIKEEVLPEEKVVQEFLLGVQQEPLE